jgi:MYXO-CTERM domain-containing protein
LRRSKVGSKITALGYGITSPSSDDSGIRRIHEDIGIECVPGDNSYSCKGLYTSDSDKEFITEGYVCSGDSGSGAFDQDSFTNGTPYVLGALSRGPQTDSKCLAAIYSRTDSHADLIIATGKKAAERGGYDAPDWVTAQSEPAIASACGGDDCSSEPAESKVVRKTTTGCAAAPTGSSPSSGLFALLGMVALATRVRRSTRA